MNRADTQLVRRVARWPIDRTTWTFLTLGALALAIGPGRSAAEGDPATLALAGSTIASPSPGHSADDSIARAKRAIAGCRARYATVRDYTCTFFKRESIDGKLSAQNVMAMKARTSPQSVYFKFYRPTPGREAIYVCGRHGGRILAHDVGMAKVVAGTMKLDPHGDFAMDGCRHPITEAGLGHLIETVAERWEVEMTPGQMVVSIHPEARVGDRSCTLIEAVHPTHRADYAFHKVRLFIDHEHGLPIRFEAYDWPKHPGAAPGLLEEYTYKDLAVNIGLRDRDFDPTNAQYSFGRF